MLARVGNAAGQALLGEVATEPAHGVVQVARQLAERAEQALFALAQLLHGDAGNAPADAAGEDD